MQLKSFSNIFSVTGSLLLAFGFAAANASAQEPTSPNATCSNATLSGRYAHLIQGAYGAPGTPEFGQSFGVAWPFQGVQTLVFNGHGTLTGSESFVASGGEITNPTGTHFVPVVGTYTINSDCSGIGYICSNHATGTLSGAPTTCNLESIKSEYGTSRFWTDFVAVTIVLGSNGKTFHMLVIPPYDGGTSASNGIVRTISSTGTKMDDTN
jgi:hypothetical protein